MREIKFRAWDPRAKAMEFTPNLELWWNEDGSLDFDEFTFMQYTGLKDKNGVEIYEGDLLDFDLIEWGLDSFMPEVVTMEKLIDWDLCGTIGDIENFRQVIGNIYENPELLND